MARIPLQGGSYVARSAIANACSCVNIYGEINPPDSPVPYTFYQRPAFRALVTQAMGGSVRGMYRASNGTVYVVIGSTVYTLSTAFVLTSIGSITAGRSNPVSMIDNRIQVMLVDGSPNGWTIDLATNTFAQIVDPTGLFTGADKVDYMDTFILFNIPGTDEFGSTLSSSITFDALYFASKNDYPDDLSTLVVNRHEIILFGAQKGSEIWFDAGNAQFPFAELPGAYIEHACAAKYSVACSDVSTFWLGCDLQGQGIVFRQRGYETKRVSNHALEYAIRQMFAQSSTISDAIGYTYQTDGHVFYVLTFPSANQTWVMDDSIEDPQLAWHRRGWTDTNGNLNRDRGNCYCFAFGMNLVGDFENGTIYALDPSVYVDTVGGATQAIACQRTFPHVVGMPGPNGMVIPADGKAMKFTQFEADIECGSAALDGDGDAANVWLEWSLDRGKTFNFQAPLQILGLPGQSNLYPVWNGLNIVGRDTVFRIGWSANGQVALNGGWVDGAILNQPARTGG